MGSTRTMLTNISQILLVLLIVLIAAPFCAMFKYTPAITAVINFLGQVPLCGTLADILSQWINGQKTSIVDITLWTFLKEFPSAILAGISIHFCISIFNRIWDPIRSRYKGFKPLPILPGFLGIILFTIITGIIGITQNDFVTFLTEIGVIAIMILGIKFIITPKWGLKSISLKSFLVWIIEGLYAVLLCTYIAGITVITQGLGGLGESISLGLTLSGATIIGSLLVHFVRVGVAKDEGSAWV